MLGVLIVFEVPLVIVVKDSAWLRDPPTGSTPLKNMIDRAIDKHQLDVVVLQRIGDGLVLGAENSVSGATTDRGDHSAGKPTGLAGKRLQRDRQGAVTQVVHQPDQVLAHLDEA